MLELLAFIICCCIFGFWNTIGVIILVCVIGALFSN